MKRLPLIALQSCCRYIAQSQKVLHVVESVQTGVVERLPDAGAAETGSAKLVGGMQPRTLCPVCMKEKRKNGWKWEELNQLTAYRRAYQPDKERPHGLQNRPEDSSQASCAARNNP